MTRPVDLSDLRAINDDAVLLDRLAAGERTDDPTVALLADLRDVAARSPVPRPIGPAPAGDGVTRRPARRAHWRAAAVLAMTALVPSTGVAAAAAHPGSPLYGIHRALLGPTADDPTVPSHLLDRAEHEVRAAAVDDRSHAASHMAAAWHLVDQARSHLPHLHASDASALADRADRVARRLGTVGHATEPGDLALRVGCTRPLTAGATVAASSTIARTTGAPATITRPGRAAASALRFVRHHLHLHLHHHHLYGAARRPVAQLVDDASCT